MSGKTKQILEHLQDVISSIHHLENEIEDTIAMIQNSGLNLGEEYCSHSDGRIKIDYETISGEQRVLLRCVSCKENLSDVKVSRLRVQS